MYARSENHFPPRSRACLLLCSSPSRPLLSRARVPWNPPPPRPTGAPSSNLSTTLSPPFHPPVETATGTSHQGTDQRRSGRPGDGRWHRCSSRAAPIPAASQLLSSSQTYSRLVAAGLTIVLLVRSSLLTW